jgi:hypothetical protein
MTYEEKLLQVFARYSGDTITSQTLVQIEKACEKEVWAHLPKDIRDSWALHLEFSDTRPGQIDLAPRQVGTLSAQDLERALKSPFVDRAPPPAGGIASFSLGFSEQPAADTRLSAVVASGETPRAAGQPAAVPPSSHAAVEPELSAQSIEADARELGITLPPNSSLLGPFLEALRLAIVYKRRAEAAEAALERK